MSFTRISNAMPTMNSTTMEALASRVSCEYLATMATRNGPNTQGGVTYTFDYKTPVAITVPR